MRCSTWRRLASCLPRATASTLVAWRLDARAAPSLLFCEPPLGWGPVITARLSAITVLGCGCTAHALRCLPPIPVLLRVGRGDHLQIWCCRPSDWRPGRAGGHRRLGPPRCLVPVATQRQL